MLEAPGLADDFYVTPLDWSASNLLAVALTNGIYLWNASTTAVAKLYYPLSELRTEQERRGAVVTSVAWRPGTGDKLAVGARGGGVCVWDASTMATEAQLAPHARRVGVLSWNPHSQTILATGSKDQRVALYDVRDRTAALIGPIATACEHMQEVCGLKWDPDGVLIASGGNDNRLILWDSRALASPLAVFTQHIAAVKAIAWSPSSRGALVSGGGSADRHLRFWDARTL
jgi:WD40 repeat protein